MILSARLLIIAAHAIKRQQEAEAQAGEKKELPLLAKALALASAGVFAYYGSKQVIEPLANWVGETFPDAAESPILKPILRALGLNVQEPLGQVPESSEAAQEDRVKDQDTFKEMEKEGEGEKRLFSPPAAAGAPEGSKATQQPYVTRKIQSLKGEHAGVSQINFLSAEERSSFESLRAQQETFRGGRGITESTKELVRKAAVKYDLPEDWIMSMVQFESGGNPNAVSSTGAVGLMQFTGGTGRSFGMTNRFNPAQNIDAGARLMVSNIKALRAENQRLAKAGQKEIPIDLTNVYLAHQMGAGGAIQIHNAAYNDGSLSEKTRRNMGLNLGVQGAESYITANAAKMKRAQVDSKATVDNSYNQPVASAPSSSTAPAVQQPKVITPAAPPALASGGAQSSTMTSAPSIAGTSSLPPRETFLVNNIPVYIK